MTPSSVSRELRLAVANRIIEAVASCGRRFLSTNSDRPGPPDPEARVSHFMLVNRRLWYVDKHRGSRIYVSYDCPWRSGWGWRFSDGGTLLDLMKHLRNFILHGVPVNVRYFGPFPQWSCGGDVWGYGPDMPLVRAKVEAILAEWDEDQKYCCASCGADRKVALRWPGGGRLYHECAVCGTFDAYERKAWKESKCRKNKS